MSGARLKYVWKPAKAGWRVHVYHKLSGDKIGAFDFPRRSITLLHAELARPAVANAIAQAGRSIRPKNIFPALVDEYQSRQCPAYARLADATRRHYDVHLRQMRAYFHDLPLAALNAPKVRLEFEQWRDQVRDRPAYADMRMVVLKQVLAHAVKQFRIDANYAAPIERVYRGKENVRAWTPDEIARIRAAAPPHVVRVINLALLTGARISALRSLSPANVRDGWLIYDPQKRGRAVRLPLDEWPDLKAEIDALPMDGLRLLNNATGKPWTASAWKSAFRRARDAAGLDSIRFHDLRVTAITYWSRDLNAHQIALLTGHSLEHVEKILDQHYMQRSDDNVILAVKKVVRAASK